MWNKWTALTGPTRRWRRHWAPGTLVLAYHRVQPPSCDPWSLGVSPENFAAHLAIIRRHCQPVSLRALAQALRERRRLPRGIVVTFDDGYLDNLTQAAPLLRQFEVPATVFIASAFLDQSHEFWWDELEQLLLHPGQLPPTLELTIGGQAGRWPLDGDATWTPADFHRHHAWRAGGAEGPTRRHHAFAALHRILVALDDLQRHEVMEQLRSCHRGPGRAAREGYRPLTRSEVRALGRCEGIDIGAHTHSHPLLDVLPIEAQREEILRGKRELESLLQRSIRSLAYPYGRHSATTTSLVRTLGFDCACTVQAGDVRGDSDPLQLNRMVVCDWTGDEFAHRLDEWMAMA